MERLPNKARKALDRDAQIAEMKKQIADMETARQRKQIDVMRRNERMITRDELRHADFLRIYKTPEQLAEEAAKLEVERLQKIIDDLMVSEDDDRMSLEEEESVEYKLLLQENRLAFVCLTVSAVHSEYLKLELQKKIRMEEIARTIASYEKLKQTLSSEETERRRQIDRANLGDWRVLENMKRADYQRTVADMEARLEEARSREHQAAEERTQQQERSATQLLVAEEDELLRAYQERLSRIERRYHDCLTTNGEHSSD